MAPQRIFYADVERSGSQEGRQGVEGLSHAVACNGRARWPEPQREKWYGGIRLTQPTTMGSMWRWKTTPKRLLTLKRVLGLGSYETALRSLHKLRQAMVRPDRNRLSGTVEVDEIYISGVKKGKRGRGAVRIAMSP
jgi:hypothetical protein